MENETFESKTTEAVGETVIKTSTTSFVEDGAIVKTALSVSSEKGGMTIQNQALKDFFMKPYLVNQATWTTASAANTDLYSFSVANTLMGNLNWLNKIQGFNNVRGTAVLRVMVNANPFQAGKLLIHFLPCYSHMDASYAAMMNSQLISKSQHPHVELDLRDGVAELEVPYITPYYFYDTKLAQYDWGNFFVTVLSPLVTGASGETAVDVSYYLYFKDFELSAPLVPQSKKWSRKGTEVEAVYAADRPVSSSLSIVAKAVDTLSAIPSIVGITEPLSWVARGLAGAASFFGWSKPQNESSPSIMTTQYNRYQGCSEGVDSALPLALMVNNKVKPLDNTSPYSGDEMSFQFLKRVVSYIDSYPWTTGQVSGTSLISIEVYPSNFGRQFTRTNGSHLTGYTIYPPFAYVASAFQAYRGSTRVILKIVKTDFHTGRLQITFTPSQNSPYISPTPSNSLLALREVVDIRSSSEICLELPYLVPADFIAFTQAMGKLDVVVLNELRCPETASGSISILMYACAGDDFEVQGPRSFPPTYSPQSKQWTQGAEVAVCDVIGDEQEGMANLDHASKTFGEYFSSVKQLLNRYANLSFSGTPSSGSTRFIWPWSIGTTVTLSTGVTTYGFVGDALSFFGPMYAFKRGSVRLGILQYSASAIVKNAFLSLVTSSSYVNTLKDVIYTPTFTTSLEGDTYTTSYLTRPGPCPAIFSDGTVQNEFIHVPFYCNNRISLNVKNSTSNKIVSSDSLPLNGVIFANFFSTIANLVVNRSCGDDFQLSYFIGAPPQFNTST